MGYSGFSFCSLNISKKSFLYLLIDEGFISYLILNTHPCHTLYK